MNIIITTSPTAATLSAPYNPGLASRAKELGGRWKPEAKCWVFASLDEQRVRELAREMFGTDGTDAAAADLVAVRVDASQYANHRSVTLAGRIILERRMRDEEPRLGQEVILVSGSFRRSSGSMGYPTIGENSAVREVRGVPRVAALAAGHEQDEFVEQVVPNTTALMDEQLRLRARLAAIDVLLG
ncbi:hypothetical protein RCH23_002133 [Cryobacterium sp. CAN_C3]|uniref:hypothetical protein n=1 Tax=unclassified Cryobacterium TaxID=2649013 RepID=UPI0018C9070B|nr:hypothetical protein [Cryobacterium sp. CAN_C3]MEC5154748.1 hypothetical protein [Cryobacterium sp. CAN_C3]